MSKKKNKHSVEFLGLKTKSFKTKKEAKAFLKGYDKGVVSTLDTFFNDL